MDEKSLSSDTSVCRPTLATKQNNGGHNNNGLIATMPRLFITALVTNLLFLSLIYGPQMVSADQMVRFVFNNGIEPSIPPCTAEDNAKIDALFVNRRRRRRQKMISQNGTIASRELQTSLQKCKENCLGIKSCRSTGCRGFDGTINNRNLNVATICQTVLASISQKLDALAVTNTCKEYLHVSKRTSECYDDVRYGEVTGAKLWTITPTSQTSQDIPATGLSFCRSRVINIEALGNTCVDAFGFDLIGPNGYQAILLKEVHPPYALFRDDGTKFLGVQLPHAGTYELTLKPDDFTTKQKKYTFTVNDAEVVGAKLWTISPTRQTSQDLPATGLSFCRSRVINIEALGNTCTPAFVFDLVGPNGYQLIGVREQHPPFALFRDDGTKFLGVTLPRVGTYSLTLTPNDVTSKQKKYTVTVNNC